MSDASLASGEHPEIGDTVILSDFARCFPHAGVGTENTAGKWWLRKYKTSAGTDGSMLCVEARDKDKPETCIAPALTYALSLSGVYDIWVGTYRPESGGGIDIKLTRDKIYGTIDPWEYPIDAWPLKPGSAGKLVEVFWKTADVAGQNFLLRQPHGTYQSLWWGLCNAHIAYIKLIRRDPLEVQRAAQAKTAAPGRNGVIIDRDGMSWVWMWGTEDIDCILQQIEQFQYGNVEALNWCLGTTFATNFPHPMSTGFTGYGPICGRLGDHRFDRVERSFKTRGIDALQTLVDRCHEIGIKIYVSQRTSEGGATDQSRTHPEWFLKTGGAKGWSANWALPEVREFFVGFMLYAAGNYDIDGLTIDFSRCRYNFEAGEEKPEHMTAYLRELRKGLDRIGQDRGKHLALNASFAGKTWYESRTPEQQGPWVKESLVDCIMPEGHEVARYIEMCRGAKTRCYPRYCMTMSFDGDSLMPNLHDPTPEEDKADRSPFYQYGPRQIAEGVLKWYEAGAEGVFLFNFSDAWITLRDLPYPDLLSGEIASGQPANMRDGDEVIWQ
ncbi:MAG: hypothetical protein NTU83_06075 [Candidatus Hydrogenedentes bacterium]|nr:hypothetical protein [Candidatus Hydrogenedentota bacterium]